METGWLNKVGAYTVEHIPCPHPDGKLALSGAARGVLHTTEGSSIEGALRVFRQHYAPHFLVGRDLRGRARIIQLIPLGKMAAALENRPGGCETNSVARVQIEIVGFSQHSLWRPHPETFKRLQALVFALQTVADIPARHVANPKREPLLWGHRGGWFGHVDIPENSHWDPGNLDYGALFHHDVIVAHTIKPKPHVFPRPKVIALKRRAKLAPPSGCMHSPHDLPLPSAR